MTGGCRTVIRAGAKYLPNVPNPVGSSRQRPTRGAGGGGQCSGLAAQILSYPDFSSLQLESVIKGVAKAKKRPKRSQIT